MLFLKKFHEILAQCSDHIKIIELDWEAMHNIMLYQTVGLLLHDGQLPNLETLRTVNTPPLLDENRNEKSWLERHISDYIGPRLDKYHLNFEVKMSSTS